MVAAGTTLQLFQAALMQQAFGAYVAVLAAEKGWSKTALSGGAALQSMESAVTSRCPASHLVRQEVNSPRQIEPS